MNPVDRFFLVRGSSSPASHSGGGGSFRQGETAWRSWRDVGDDDSLSFSDSASDGDCVHDSLDSLNLVSIDPPPQIIAPVSDANNSETVETDLPTTIEGPLSPWRNSKSKERIIKMLKSPTSDIHLHLPLTYGPNNWQDVNFGLLQRLYADGRYTSGNFRENVKRILIHFRNSTGPFEPAEDAVEKWYTSPNNVSKAYALLFALMMKDESMRSLNSMSDIEIWRSHDEFQKYEFDKFKVYITNMKKLTRRRKEVIAEEQRAYDSDVRIIELSEDSGRGYPKWNTHLASDLLHEDETSGRAKEMKPFELWMSREEYQDFPLKVFRKHVYQERMAQLAAPCWQHKRNQNAKKMYEESLELIKEWHGGQFARDMDEIVGRWETINFVS